MFKYFIIIFSFILVLMGVAKIVYDKAYKAGYDNATLFYTNKINELNALHLDEITKQLEKNRELSISYVQEQNKNQELYAKNIELINSIERNGLQQSAPAPTNDNKKAGDRGAINTTNQAPRCDISAKILRDFAIEAKRADEVAIYANKCYEYVKSLNADKKEGL